ncbi:MAG: dinitrogenase iron-molybdenum cofactor biosynthesis protein [Desulfonatronovibrio sp. MSAO_Bac4]|nr:MAG: dinitrogenase iron-molybdenum cofactor biosynthesis protein [Desulfonatronovibrio sp. MSAO_Bac4]
MAPFKNPENIRALVTVHDHNISPRFDHTLEVLIVEKSSDGRIVDRKNLLLSEPSAEEVCNIVQTESVRDVICGGLDEEFYQYLTWKKITVYDNIIGPVDSVLNAWQKNRLKQDKIFR